MGATCHNKIGLETEFLELMDICMNGNIRYADAIFVLASKHCLECFDNTNCIIHSCIEQWTQIVWYKINFRTALRVRQMKNQTKLIYPFLGSKPIGKH